MTRWLAKLNKNRFAPEITISLIGWLELHDRIVVNGSKAIKIELSKDFLLCMI